MKSRRWRRSQAVGVWKMALFVLAATLGAGAQSFPVAETYVGFAVHNNPYGEDRHNSAGVILNFGYNVSRNLRVVADFGAESHDTNIVWANGRPATARDYQLLFGPEFTIRKSPKVTPFVHGLAGLAVRSYAVPNGNWTCSNYTCYEDSFSIAKETGFAGGVGGGLDWHVHPVISVRVVQFDWIRSHLGRDVAAYPPIQNQLPVVSGWQNNYRFSCGVTLRWGTRDASR